MSYYIYAETAFHHEGNKDYLIKLIDEAKKSGVDGVKFQVLIELVEFMSSKHSAFTQAKDWTLSMQEWKEVFEYTEKLGLDIILMPLDTMAFELSKLFEIKHIEIHSVSFKDKKLLSLLDKNTTPLILGIGGRTLEEIGDAVTTYKDRDLTLMVGFQSYPSKLEDIKIGRIKELINIYPNCTIGYADHTSYDNEMAITSNEYAYILGARTFEKHIALEEGKERIDFQSAVSAEKILTIKTKLEFLDKLLSMDKNNLFEMNEKEVNYRNRQKLPVAKHNLEIGQTITENDFELKMIDSENSVEDIGILLGKKLKSNVSVDSPFVEKDF